MRLSILTLFPQLFDAFLATSILGRAQKQGLAQIEIIDFRAFATGKHLKVDSPPFGGGAGMVLKVEPIVKCLQTIKTPGSQVWLLSPEGKPFSQQMATEFATNVAHLILVAGHYEGFDWRLRDYVDGAISIGDYVLTGGEIPAMVVTDAIIRLIPGVINRNSLTSESFTDGLLDHPTYTKPAVFANKPVPPVLLSGNHQAVDAFNFAERVRITKAYRPDLYRKWLKNHSTPGVHHGQSKQVQQTKPAQQRPSRPTKT